MMKEYTTLFLRESVTSFETKTVKKFEKSLNQLANQGWIIKSSGLLVIPAENVGLAVYAILEREKA